MKPTSRRIHQHTGHSRATILNTYLSGHHWLAGVRHTEAIMANTDLTGQQAEQSKDGADERMNQDAEPVQAQMNQDVPPPVQAQMNQDVPPPVQAQMNQDVPPPVQAQMNQDV